MKSIKRGRGPSMMDGVISVAMAVFGLIWMAAAAGMGGGFFALFGLVFVGIAVVQAVYAFSNATRKERFSEYDITSENEESDPLNSYFGRAAEETYQDAKDDEAEQDSVFCPFCGAKAGKDYVYCNQCGRKLP